MRIELIMRKKWGKAFLRILGAALLTTVVAVGGAERTSAVEIGKVNINGFGHQGLLLTGGKNEFLFADETGTWNFNSLALLFSSRVNDKTTVYSQIQLDEDTLGDQSNNTLNNSADDPAAGTRDETDSIGLDWAFVDYRFNEDLSVRGGQVKMPWGIYNELRDVKYLHLSTVLPYMYVKGKGGTTDIVHEALRGVAATYRIDLGGAGRLVIDPVVGEIADEGSSLGIPDALGNRMGMKMEHGLLVGGRITYDTPIDGLTLMSTFSSSEMYMWMQMSMSMMGTTSWMTPVEEWDKMEMLITSLEYVNNGIDLKAEYATMDMMEKAMLKSKMESYYVQAGYNVTDKWTPFVRYDYILTDDEDSSGNDLKSDPRFYQKAMTVGVGYKINYNLALKAEYHSIKGYALTDKPFVFSSGKNDKNWDLFAASISFIF